MVTAARPASFSAAGDGGSESGYCGHSKADCDLSAGRARPQDALESHMSAPLPMVGSGEPLSQALGSLERAGAALVLVDGKPAGMITPPDVR